MAVRSQLLAHVATLTSGGTTVLYTCPAGRTAIVKDFVVWNYSGAARNVNVRVRRGGADAYVLVRDGLPNREHVAGSARYWVLEPGDALVVGVGAEIVSNQLSAYAAGVELLGEPA